MNDSESKRTIIIVGGLSAGPSAAARARRLDENANILLFEKEANISYATCGLPYALSGVIPRRERLLVVKPELLEKRFRIEMHLREEVLEIDPAAKTVTTAKGPYAYDKLIVATGARAVLPPVKNLAEAANRSFLRTLEDFDSIVASGALAGKKNIAVLGGGLIGVEAVENLKALGHRVSLVEGLDRILPQWNPLFANFAADVIRANGVDLYTGQFLDSVTLQGDQIRELVFPDGKTVPCDYLIVAAGIKPNSELLSAAGARRHPNGALIVNERMETSIPDVFAAGDVATVPNPLTGEPDYFPLGTHSNKAGRTAGENAVGGKASYRGGYGTAIVKIFDQTLARTGWTGRGLVEKNIAHRFAYINAPATPGYYPDSKNLVVEIAYQVDSGKLLSAEVWGEHGADKRIDVFSTAIYAGLTVEDLPNLDLAYAPPFSPAKDPVIVSGYVASNHRKHACAPLSTDELRSALGQNDLIQLVDVRTASEIKREGKIDGAIHIELDDLRERLDDLDRNREIILYCAKGIRGYLGVLILRHHGLHRSKNLAGGFMAWQAAGGRSKNLE